MDSITLTAATDDVMLTDDGRIASEIRDGMLIAQENWGRYRYGVDRGHREYTWLAARLEGMYLGSERDGDGNIRRGGQWSDEDLAILAEQGRPAYEFNDILPSINSAVGYQIQNRMDIAFRPRQGDATKELAEVRSKVAMQIADNNKLHWRETEVFADGMIQQRGYFDVRVDFDDSIQGELRITVLDPLDVIPDPDAKSYDPRDWSDVIIVRWLTLDEIEGLYGEEARRRAELAPEHWLIDRDFGDQDDEGAERSKFGRELERFDAAYSTAGKRRLRVIDRQRFVRKLADVVVYPTGDVRTLKGDESPADMADLAAQGVVFTKRRMKRVRWTVTTYSATLHDDWSPYDRLTVVPFFPFFRRGKTRGMVDNAIDPQRALNKGMSQMVHIINTTANSGWVVEEDSLTNMTTEELEERGASTGLVIEHARGSTAPRKIQPNSVPTGIDRIIERAGYSLKEVTVPDAMRGNQGREESGIAIQSKQHAAQQGLAVPLDNLARTRAMLAEWIDYAITCYYDAERVMRITKTNPMTGQDDTQEIVLNKMDPATGAYINDMTAGEYDVVVSEQPMQVTFENSQFKQVLEMRQNGIGIPDPFIIKHSNLSDKHEIIQAIEGAGQQQPDPLAEAEKALTEARAEKERALAMKARADAVTSGVGGMYSATQAAATIAAQPAVAPLADDLLRSAGFIDQDAAPIVPQMTAPAPGVVPPDVDRNTSPMFPPRANPDGLSDPAAALVAPSMEPASPQSGIETQQLDGATA